VGERHRLDLVMGDIDRRHLKIMLQPFELGPHLDPELGIEIGQRLVEQEHPGRPDDRPRQRHSLALAARQLARQPRQQRLQLDPPRDLLDPPFELRRRNFADHQRIADIVGDRQMRIKRIGLEHHRDIAIFRQDVVHPLIAEIEVTRRHLLEPGDHPHGRRLAAAGRPEQHQEFLVDHLEIEVRHSDEIAEILGDVIESHRCHGFSPLPRRRTAREPDASAR
jgi:hypothetical protein